MPLPSTSTLFAWTALAVLAAKLVSWHRGVKKLPPGPSKLPFIDNLHNVPGVMNWLEYAELGKRHKSDIIHLAVLGNSIVVLNSYQAAQDLLEQRSSIYSSRPFSTMINKLSGFSSLFVFSEYNDYWKASRRLFTKHFGGNENLHQQPEVFYVRRFLGQLLESPELFRLHIRHFVGSVSISMTYGLNPQPKNDPHIKLVESIIHDGVKIFMGTHLVDAFPALKHLPDWFPGASFKRVARSMTELVSTSRNTIFQDSLAVMETAVRVPSLVSGGMQDIEDSMNPKQDLQLLKDVASQVYLAAADTTVSALSTFFLAMVCYPEVQRKLQHELDAALQGRLPEHEDLASLPYLTAVVMEVLRWKPVAPIGNPHRTTADDVYRGYLIPKDTIVLANQWAMSYDPTAYPNPSEFNPERFLRDGKIDESVRNPVDMAFGFGRRLCPGRHIALSTITITAASVLSTFDILKAVDKDGNDIEPTKEYHMTAISHPKDFPCVIKPRSRQAEELIASIDAS